MTNCVAGDLAFIVNERIEGLARRDCPSLIGKIVRVLRVDRYCATAWDVEFERPVMSQFPGLPSRLASWEDDWLKPIRNNPGTDEVIAKVGKPKKTPIKVTSEYEAARIAETTPGAHVQVVRNDVLVSEFFGVTP